ncbi:MAG: C40 family peptidase, partial [Sulfuricella denitrificans]|nr:C40 family peptidase [Sulfuricella denitrificans]
MAGNILNAQKFFESGYGYSTNGGIGLSTNSSGQRLIDCSGLVYQMARAAGFNVPRFGTGDLLDASGNIKPGASRFYQQVDKQDIQPGDILVFANDGHTTGHAGVYQEGAIKDSSFTGDFFGAQNSGIRTEKVEGGKYWSDRTVLGVIRPRADRYDPALDQTGRSEIQLTPTAITSQTLARQVTRLTDREFDVYKEAVAGIEAKGHANDDTGWQLVDRGNVHWGRYQMGKDALVEAGFMDKAGNWVKPGINSKEAFLNSPEAQDQALRSYADKNADWAVKNNYDLRIGETLADSEVTKIGLLMSEHHERGSTAKFMNSDGAEEKQDANGVGPGYYLAAGAKATKDAGLSAGDLNTGGNPIPFTPTQDSPLTGQPYPHDAYPGDGFVTRNPDGSVTYSGTATADSPQGIFFKGDRTSQTYGADGKLIDVVIYDKTTDLPRERFSADTPVESLEAATYLGSDGAEYLYADGLFVNIATGESRETLPAGPSQVLPAKITSWNIQQADDTTIIYELLPGGDWKLTHRDADGQLIDTTQSLKNGGWIKTDGNGNVLDGYTQDGTPFEERIAPSAGNAQPTPHLDENGLPLPEIANTSTQNTDPILAALLEGYQQGSQSGLAGGTHYADARGTTDIAIGEAEPDPE